MYELHLDFANKIDKRGCEISLTKRGGKSATACCRNSLRAYFKVRIVREKKMYIDFKVAAFNEKAYSFNTPNQKCTGHLDFKALGKSK